MNYLTEIVAFTEWKEVNQLPASAIALWYELMAICNKTGWRQEFTVPNGLLQIKAGLSRKEFDRARQLLIQAGRINYKKSNRVNEAGKYQIIPFVQKGQRGVQQKGQQEGQQEVQREEHRRGNERGTLFKHKLKLKQKINHDDSARAHENDFSEAQRKIVATHNQEFGRLISQNEVEQLMAFVELGMEADVVCEALKKTRLNGKTSVSYALSILRNWADKGVINIAGVVRANYEYEQLKNRKGTSTGGLSSHAGNSSKAADEKKERLMRSMYC